MRTIPLTRPRNASRSGGSNFTGANTPVLVRTTGIGTGRNGLGSVIHKRLARLRDPSSATPLLGGLYRDWKNAFASRHIALLDPWLSIGRDFHLRQHVPRRKLPPALPVRSGARRNDGLRAAASRPCQPVRQALEVSPDRGIQIPSIQTAGHAFARWKGRSIASAPDA